MLKNITHYKMDHDYCKRSTPEENDMSNDVFIGENIDKMKDEETSDPTADKSIEVDQTDKLDTLVTDSKQNDDPDTISLSETDDDTPQNTDILCQYPPNSRGSIPITLADVETLYPGKFLNDTIVDFFLKYLHTNLHGADKDTVHIFPSTLFKKLVMVPMVGTPLEIKERNSSLSISEKRHARVSSWTKHMNLLDKDIVLVPICEASHWFLVVVVNPGGDKPCFLVLDSMGGRREAAVEIIKEFIATERKHKMTGSANTPIKILYPVTPKQTNGYDCGIFLLHYAEKILSSATNFSCCTETPSLHDWFPVSELANKRYEIVDLILNLASKQKENQNQISYTVGTEPVPDFLTKSSEQRHKRQHDEVIRQENSDRRHQGSGSRQESSCSRQDSSESRKLESQRYELGNTGYTKIYIGENDGDKGVSEKRNQDTGDTQQTNGYKGSSGQISSQDRKTIGKNISCSVCLRPFSSQKCLRQHLCPIKEVVEKEVDLRVLNDENKTSMTKILINCNTSRQIANICETGGFCLKGSYPYLFPKKKQNMPILDDIGVTGAQAYEKLKDAVSEGPMILKKVIKIEINGKLLELGPDITIPHTFKNLGDVKIEDLGDRVKIEILCDKRGPRTGDRRCTKGSVKAGEGGSDAGHGDAGHGDSRTKPEHPPPQQFQMVNKFRHPEYLSREEFRQRVKIFPDEFQEICTLCLPATSNRKRNDLSHKVRGGVQIKKNWGGN